LTKPFPLSALKSALSETFASEPVAA